MKNAVDTILRPISSSGLYNNSSPKEESGYRNETLNYPSRLKGDFKQNTTPN